MYENEQIKNLLEYKPSLPYNRLYRDSLVLIIFFGIPTAVLGIGSFITSIIMIPIDVFFIIWTIIRMTNKKDEQKWYSLHNGIISVYLSFVLIIAAYKLISLITYIPLYILGLAILSLLIINVFVFLLLLKIIKKGKAPQKSKNAGLIAIAPFAALGMYFGKVTEQYLSQNTAIMFVSCVCLFVGFVFSLGSTNLIRYYFIRLNEKRVMERSSSDGRL